MTEGTTLDELLGEPQAATEAPPAELAPEPAPDTEQPAEGAVRDEQGRFAPKTGVDTPTGDAVPPTAGLPKEEYGALRAVRDENKALKDRLAALEQAQPPKEPTPPPPTLWEDEQGWAQHQQQVILQQADMLSRVNASEMAARSQHPDFQEKFELFNQMAAENPQLVKQAMTDPHPWAKAYQIANNYKQMQEMGATNLDELRAKIREELQAETQTQQFAQVGASPTLTNQRNVGARSGPAWSGPASLDQLLR